MRWSCCELAEAENDEAAARDIEADAQRLEADVRHLELKRMFHGEMDSHNAFLDIQAGAGGTEAQDWAQMLLRMYLRWARRAWLQRRGDRLAAGRGGRDEERHHRRSRATTPTAGCAPRSACTAWCASRPFDSGNRRHTSFASVFVSPEVDDDIDIDDQSGGPAHRRVPLLAAPAAST